MCREPLDEGLRLIVQVICEKKDEEPKLGITFNNNWPDFNGIKTSKLLFPCGIYTDITDNCAAYNFEVDPSLLRTAITISVSLMGKNRPPIRNQDGKTSSAFSALKRP